MIRLGALLFALAAALPLHAAEPGDQARAIERLFRGGDAAQAMQKVDAALVERPADATLKFLKGVMLSETHRELEAMALFEAMTQEFPDQPEPYNNLAVLLAAKGQLDRSHELLEMALRLDPGYTTARENLGDVLVRLAQRAFERAGGAAPNVRLERKLKLLRELAAPPTAR